MSTHPDYSEEVKALLENHLFSPAFYRLCTGLEDFDGLIAYGIYKDHKRRALLEKPMKRSDATFHKVHHHLNDSQRDTLWKDAQLRLKSYADKVIEDATPSIQRDYIKTHIAKRERWQFWKGVGASLTASVAMMLIVGVSPWFAQQNPAYFAEQIDDRLAKIEQELSTEKASSVNFNQIEPAAGDTEVPDGLFRLQDLCGVDPDTSSATCDAAPDAEFRGIE